MYIKIVITKYILFWLFKNVFTARQIKSRILRAIRNSPFEKAGWNSKSWNLCWSKEAWLARPMTKSIFWTRNSMWRFGQQENLVSGIRAICYWIVNFLPLPTVGNLRIKTKPSKDLNKHWNWKRPFLKGYPNFVDCAFYSLHHRV